MTYEVALANSDSLYTSVIRECVPPHELARFVPAACGEVWSFVRSARLPKPGRHVALYLDGGSVEIGVEVSAPFVGNDRVHCSRLPAGRVVTTIHFAPYSLLGHAHEAIRRWCAEQRFQLSRMAWELYGHWQESWNADPSKVRTDVIHLLRDKAAKNESGPNLSPG
jgi:hypothetical protein